MSKNIPIFNNISISLLDLADIFNDPHNDTASSLQMSSINEKKSNAILPNGHTSTNVKKIPKTTDILLQNFDRKNQNKI